MEQTLLFDTRRMAVSALLALAPEVEVLAPEELREELIAVTEQVIARCRTEPAGSVRQGRLDLRPLLGTSVAVTIDRPLGSAHPRHGFRYPVNYGYVAGTIAADDEPIDAYVLGIEEPVSEIEGIVVGLVLRADDVEDKLIVAPAGKAFTAAEIEGIVDFQERFFDSQIEVFDPSRT